MEAQSPLVAPRRIRTHLWGRAAGAKPEEARSELSCSMASLLISRARRLIRRTFLPDVAIHGRHGPSWHKAIDARAPVWDLLGAAGIAQSAKGAPRWWRKRVVVPLMEPHILSMPEGCHALVPDSEALAILADKAQFARYAAELGAAHLLPRSIDLEHPTFPAMLKRTNLHSGMGVALVASQQELDEKRAAAPWVGEVVLLQEAVPSHREFVTHVVCVRGRIVWHCTFAYPLASRNEVRGPVENLTIEQSSAHPADIQAFEQLLLPLGFNGPANIDYRRRPDGSLAIFEINPRLGGSLMRPDHVRDLAGALQAIVRHATWRPRMALSRPTDTSVPSASTPQ
jgi:hypothetical protein